MRYVIDSYAWIEYLDGTPAGIKVKEVLIGNNDIYTLSLCMAEIMSRAARTGKDVDRVYNAISVNSKFIQADLEFSKNAGLLHAEMRKKIRDFGLIDAFVLLTARKLKAKIITGDEHFRKFKNVILVK